MSVDIEKFGLSPEKMAKLIEEKRRHVTEAAGHAELVRTARQVYCAIIQTPGISISEMSRTAGMACDWAEALIEEMQVREWITL